MSACFGSQLYFQPRQYLLFPKKNFLGLFWVFLGVLDGHQDERLLLYARPKAVRQKWEEALLERFKARMPERMVDAKNIHSEQGSYFHALLDIEPCGGTYIYSSSEAFDEEMLIDHQRVRNWIDFFGLKLYGNLGREREESGFHASGHTRAGDRGAGGDGKTGYTDSGAYRG